MAPKLPNKADKSRKGAVVKEGALEAQARKVLATVANRDLFL